MGGGDWLDGVNLYGKDRHFTPFVLSSLPPLAVAIDVESGYRWRCCG